MKNPEASPDLVTKLEEISRLATEKEWENETFRQFLRNFPEDLDPIVHELNQVIEPLIDCTACGNCCRSLMINVSATEADTLAKRLDRPLPEVKAEFLEESAGGQLIINTIPCHFLSGNICTIYPDRFVDCREFPHLHKPLFSQRVFGSLMHYGRCPIIFNVIEKLKHRTNFITS